MSMHPKVADAFEQIDAAIFSGDEFFDPINLNVLTDYIQRWQRQIPHLTEMSQPESQT